MTWYDLTWFDTRQHAPGNRECFVPATPRTDVNRDLGVTGWLVERVPEWSVPLFSFLSALGDLLVIVPVLGLLYVLDVYRSAREGHTEGPLCADRTAFLVATVFGGLALIVALESIFAQPRPPADWHAVPASAYGFPSGHTMAATVAWGAIALWGRVGAIEGVHSIGGVFENRRARLAAAGATVVAVGVSRLALGLHYLVDVIASVGFGAAYLVVVWRLADGRPERAFAGALGIAVVAIVVSGGGSRAVLAMVGTVGAAMGWRIVELPAIRGRLVGVLGRDG